MAAVVAAAADTVVDCIVVVAAAAAEALVQLAVVAKRIAAAEPVEAFAGRPAVVEDEIAVAEASAVAASVVLEVFADTVDWELVVVASDCTLAVAVAFVAEAVLPNRELRDYYCCST